MPRKQKWLGTLALPAAFFGIFACQLSQPAVEPTKQPPTEIPDDSALIEAALIAETGIPEQDFSFGIDVNTGSFARGVFGDALTEARSLYIAKKTSAGWVIAYTGDLIPLCDDLAAFDFPLEVMPECLPRTVVGYPTIRAALLAATGIPESDLEFLIGVNTGFHIKGTILPNENVEASTFLAALIEAGWIMVHNGEGTPTCIEIEAYNFPLDFVPECYDAEGALINRSAAFLPLIEAALADETGINAENLDFTIGLNTGSHIWGNVREIGDVISEYYLAARVDDEWIIAYYGQVTPLCSQVDPHLFPSSMVPTCNDERLNPIDRSTYDSLAIQAALVEYTGIPPEEIEFTIDQNTGLHANGTVSQKAAISGGHYLAVKVEGTWIVVFDGQDAPFCADIEAYNFPSEILPFCQ